MRAILISINPDHVEKILNGTKRFEFRKVRCNRDIDKMVFYSTSPVMKVVGEAAVYSILEGTPDEIWESTKDATGISRQFFDKYYQGRDIAIAYVLGDVTQYDVSLGLDHFGVNAPPQSFVYLDDRTVIRI